MSFTDRSHPAFAGLLAALFFIVYYFCLPSTVQTLDTAEMSANAFRSAIIHPPGYPLFMWLYGTFQRAFSYSTPYFRSALLTAILAASVLALLAASLPKLKWGATAAVLATLASFQVFWEFAVLPDVFMLHALLTAGMVTTFLSPWNARRRLYLQAILLSLGASHHHTAVFLMPLFLLTAWELRSIKDFALASILGLSMTAGLYLSLLTVSTGGVLDYRPLENVGDLFAHFLRRDYGTFRLASNAPEFVHGGVFTLFFRRVFSGIPLLFAGTIAALIFCLMHLRAAGRVYGIHAKVLAVAGTLLLYVGIFFPLCNLPAFGGYIPMLERFFIMPAVIMAILAVYGIAMASEKLRPAILKAIPMLAILSALGNLSAFAKMDYSNDTLIEDYAVDMLHRASENKPSILLVRGDTMIFAAHYLQFALGLHPDVPVLTTEGQMRPHYVADARKHIPDFEYPPAETPRAERERKFLEMNSGRFAVFSMTPVDAPGKSMRVLKAGFQLVASADPVLYEDPLPLTLRTPLHHLENFGGRYSLSIYNLRCPYHLVHADAAYQKGDYKTAAAIVKEAAVAFPICFAAKERQCQVYQEHPDLGDPGVCAREYDAVQRMFPEEYAAFLAQG